MLPSGHSHGRESRQPNLPQKGSPSPSGLRYQCGGANPTKDLSKTKQRTKGHQAQAAARCKCGLLLRAHRWRRRTQLRSTDHQAQPQCTSTCKSKFIIALSLDPVTGKKALANTLENWGFALHEEMSATSYFPTLGGIIDGNVGVVKPTENRFWNLRLAFEFVCKHPVSSDLIQRLLGHAMVALVLNRAGVSVFRSLCDFAGRGFKRKMLWDGAIRGCKIFLVSSLCWFLT